MDTIEHVDQLQDHWWWRPGWRAGRHFYACHITIEDQPELQRLVARYRAALANIKGLDLIPDRWLHLTMQGIGFVDEVSDADLGAVRDAIAGETVQVQGPTVVFHRPVVRLEAVYLPATPAAPLRDLRAAVRSGIVRALGAGRVADATESLANYRPHVSIAYSNTDQDAEPIVAALRAVEADAARVTFAHLSLLEFHRDNRMYEWVSSQPLPLSPGADGPGRTAIPREWRTIGMPDGQGRPK